MGRTVPRNAVTGSRCTVGLARLPLNHGNVTAGKPGDKGFDAAPLQRLETAGPQHFGLGAVAAGLHQEIHQIIDRAFGADHRAQVALSGR